MTRVAVTGATGAMGETVLAVASERFDVEAVLAVTRASPEEVARDIPVCAPNRLDSALDEQAVDVLVDFTVPSAAVDAVEAAAGADVAAVVGTTGFDAAQRNRLEAAAQRTPLLVAPNFSRGIQALVGALEGTVKRLPGYDIEVTETHHQRKRDAPSGTADQLVEAIEAQRPDATRVHGREGEAPREDGDIGIHARRAGSITGEHEVLLAANDEEIRLTHRAESRAVFAAGALDAAVWLDGRPPGRYHFETVVEA